MRAQLRDSRHDPAAARRAFESWLAANPTRRTIAVYSALPGEVDLAPVISSWPDIRWVYPRVTGDHLTFHAPEDSPEDLQSGSFGILEPALHLTEIQLAEIDAFICPGLAFDPHGGRLGRGRGFYDRLLDKARADALKIGICFQHQLVSDTFPEPHDVRMDEVLRG